MPGSTGLIKKTRCNTKIIEIENKQPMITGLVSETKFITKVQKLKIKSLTFRIFHKGKI